MDNLSRCCIDVELEYDLLTPIRPMGERLRARKEVFGKSITFHRFDVAENYQCLLDFLCEWQSHVVVYFSEQYSAPYSMKTSYHKRYTVNNNLNATNNLLAAVVESGQDIHIVHLGTMGVYGYGTEGMKIPEGHLRIKVETDDSCLLEQEIFYPPNLGSIYHIAKKQDQFLFAYDGDCGTVLNRFLMQVVGNQLTEHNIGATIENVPHLCVDVDENELHIANECFLHLGLLTIDCWMRSERVHINMCTAAIRARFLVKHRRIVTVIVQWISKCQTILERSDCNPLVLQPVASLFTSVAYEVSFHPLDQHQASR